MRLRATTLFVAGGMLAAGASAHAVEYQLAPISGYLWDTPATESVPTGSTYGVFTGVATSTGGLALIEPTNPPVRDDLVINDGASDQINDYIAAAGSVQRFVTETDIDNGNGTRTYTVTVTGQLPAGGPGDLFPAGFQTGTGEPLPNGGFGLGLNLPASVGGADPVNWQTLDVIQSATLAVATNGTFGTPSALPSTFFDSPTYPAATWDGVIGISLTNAATGTTIQDGVRLAITYTTIPEPIALAVLPLGAMLLGRRRR